MTSEGVLGLLAGVLKVGLNYYNRELQELTRVELETCLLFPHSVFFPFCHLLYFIKFFPPFPHLLKGREWKVESAYFLRALAVQFHNLMEYICPDTTFSYSFNLTNLAECQLGATVLVMKVKKMDELPFLS